LITGAGGSIGSEISKQTMNLKPSKLILLDNNELALYKISETLKKNQKGTIIPVLGSVTNNLDLTQIFKAHKIDTIFHCAAYKHVPIVENNPIQGIKNNIFGTYNVIDFALKNKVKNFVLISTDTAVRPSSVMGASKRVAEIILQAVANENVYTNFTAVRFGNVLGSSGSVVPKFLNQIRAGGPVTVTHKKIKRYFMTIGEASSLVIQASSLSVKGGGIYLFEMGDPVFIYNLAQRMINLSGSSIKDKNNPNGDIEIKITGLSPGEKIHEELLINSDAEETLHPKILKANEQFTELKKVKKLLKELDTEINKQDLKNIMRILKELVPEYQISKQIKVKI
jgi:FlaA1/EpsC-like NDP-sugar epimerase